MTPQEVKHALLQGQFQPNDAYVTIDFLDRHGFLKEEEGMEEVRKRSRREQGVAKPLDICE